MRGGDSGHILILVDGVPFYDATTIQRSFNLNSLDIRTVEKIEIIKGSQSVLFGGQALSGVIKITTIPSQARKPMVVVEAGTHDKANIGAAYQKNWDQDLLSVRARVGTKNNESPVLDSEKIYPNKNLSTDLIYRHEAEWFVQGKLSYLADEANSPSTNFATFKIIDADDFVIKNDQTAISVLTGSKKLSYQPLITLSQQWSKRTFKQPTSTPVTDQEYAGQVTQVRAEGRVLDLEKSQLLMGVQYTKEAMIYHDLGIQKVDVYSELRGIFAKYDQALNEDFKFAAGTRFESWENQDGVLTGQLGLVFRENTKLEVATGFKAPSLFQLYSSYGNPELDAEKSVSYSLSHQKAITEDMNASMTLFYTKFENLIETQGTPARYYNVAKSNTKGVEVAYSWSFAPTQQISLSAGYQEPWDETNHRWLLRRALTTASLRYGLTVEQLVTQAELIAVGSRGDRTGPASYGEIPGYVIANLSGTYNFSELYSGYIRIDNVADYRYQASYSYYAEGIAATLGYSALF
jgi:iron complex outermembrane receptor protein/vitamin B12 transporter